MIPFNVKVELDVPDEKKPEVTKTVSFSSTVFDIDKRIINDGGKQVLQTMFLVYASKDGFMWVSASACRVDKTSKK